MTADDELDIPAFLRSQEIIDNKTSRSAKTAGNSAADIARSARKSNRIPKEIDLCPVDAAVFCPPEVQAGTDFLLQVCIYSPGFEKAASKLIKLSDPDAVKKGVFSFPLDIPSGTRVEFRAEIDHLQILEPDGVIVWKGLPVVTQFEVTVPKTVTMPQSIGRIRISVSGVPVGAIRFILKISKQISKDNQYAQQEIQIQRYKRAFVSYASKDRAEVLRRVQAFKIAGIEIFQDVLSLAPGDRWNQQLYKEIDKCDVFLLFWSHSAADSEWVSKEIEYALNLKMNTEDRPPFIQPIPIEGPPIAPPPKLLEHLHFNDALLAYMRN
ncbi:hypothetical protein GCM10007887_38860 [Methylobacterium haplocladii]|uniref:TIR domain-containing protein n=1 Tax=Methylobacterium haplocladii TaxID=1176176 RepID=A0A512IRM2_9HYPH|nr:hypothetical protein MHA02_27230 [Methylobacterium haplocladii]GLS61189.1 hypothetical protein GCM10007887_38860 [Methylobacterium haplocladii]